jgi:hypothetical protein
MRTQDRKFTHLTRHQAGWVTAALLLFFGADSVRVSQYHVSWMEVIPGPG